MKLILNIKERCYRFLRGQIIKALKSSIFKITMRSEQKVTIHKAQHSGSENQIMNPNISHLEVIILWIQIFPNNFLLWSPSQLSPMSRKAKISTKKYKIALADNTSGQVYIVYYYSIFLTIPISNPLQLQIHFFIHWIHPNFVELYKLSKYIPLLFIYLLYIQ